MGNTTSANQTPGDPFVGNKEVSSVVPAEKLDDDQVVKIKRQLVFEKARRENLMNRATDLVAVTQHDGFQVPKVRYGKTELMMPIITCGGMRVQQTWCPDDLGAISTSSMRGIDKKCQANLTQIIRRALSLGINHFETARFYGTSELQYADALATMIESGEVKREDLIIQTKIKPFATVAEFRKTFEQSWKHMSRLGYIDLFSFHGVSGDEWFDFILDNGEESNMAAAEALKAEGRIRHIGVSTHGSARFVRRLIETDKFAYINLHYHFFGSYHASGTPDGDGGQGNALNMKLCKDRDMGIFIISPFDKGGALYKPTKTVVDLVGSKLSPIAFQALWLWKLAPVPAHTIVLGAARPSDFDEAVAAARLLDKSEMLDEATSAAARLNARLADAGYPQTRELSEQHGGKPLWWENVPDFFDAKSNGMALGHILWLHSLVKAFGMYDFAKARYGNLESTRGNWKGKDSFEANVKRWTFNPGLCCPPGPQGEKEVAAALDSCPNPEAAVAAVRECHSWLCKATPAPTDAQRRERGWTAAYDLVPWTTYAGDNVTPSGVVLQQVSGGMAGVGGGPNSKSKREAATARKNLKAAAADPKS